MIRRFLHNDAVKIQSISAAVQCLQRLMILHFFLQNRDHPRPDIRRVADDHVELLSCCRREHIASGKSHLYPQVFRIFLCDRESFLTDVGPQDLYIGTDLRQRYPDCSASAAKIQHLPFLAAL